jgi:hypothetical protein
MNFWTFVEIVHVLALMVVFAAMLLIVGYTAAFSGVDWQSTQSFVHQNKPMISICLPTPDSSVSAHTRASSRSGLRWPM